MKKENTKKSRREFIGKSGSVAGLAALTSLFANTAQAHTVEINAMGPTPEQAQAFAQLPDQPVVMVNLLKFADGGAGEAAYSQYGRDVNEVLQQIGAEIIFSGDCQTTLIGAAE